MNVRWDEKVLAGELTSGRLDVAPVGLSEGELESIILENFQDEPDRSAEE
jgi:hypothetical protein